jgi:Lon protease-like protein
MEQRADLLSPVIPIFPLGGAILLAGAQLPLNIFEPRYLAMVRDAMAGARLIGIVQPDGRTGGTRPSVYPVGCVGRITSYSETTDGRYLITLTGLQRFRIAEELAVTTLYRQVRADYSPFEQDDQDEAPLADARRAQLVAALRGFLDAKGLGADWKAIEDADDPMLVNALAMLCPFESSEKQLLLEAETLGGRADLLITLMAFAEAPSQRPN